MSQHPWDIRGKRVTVVGMGRTAMAVVRLLLREGARPFVTESSTSVTLEPFQLELHSLGVPSEIGGHTNAAFEDATLVIPSPGVPPDIAPIREAAARGTNVVGEMEFAFPYCQSRIIAVTGTNGKTTTTELIRALIANCGHTVTLAGNNALPFSQSVIDSPTPLYTVLEVSSYQLETARRFRPWIGAVLNVTPDHLARHKSVDDYAAVKAKMFAQQQAGDHAVINYDDPFTRGMAAGGSQTVVPFSRTERLENGVWADGPRIRFGDEEIAHLADIRIPGQHNLSNALAALAVMRAGRFAWDKIRAGLYMFQGVEHRIERVATIDHVTYVNDSKSTNLDSLRVALESFDRPVVLIAGGRGKGSDYGVLSDLIAAHVTAIVTIGEDAPLIETAFKAIVPIVAASNMDDAVSKATQVSKPGHIVLLSPGCASFDMFDNFEHRGRVFKECVQRRESLANQNKNAHAETLR